ncbi:hypothetical protein A3A38_00985 [Candidatus Kaiserbacteria bacterium RIFCSPLOWO2_01_FULL_53_17]|uniref:DUF1003 domain-containing protein n=1 Tax=Candidatus Kaiserbacteria bacterium RIFCSPLOWO2_01_FULL_53_17 TaxID=1798511 RepID=A0A1F6EHA0_9BACT|nr:MAG: hypothetical protein A3A38_00985 [Candidatus Kaiserbacteria bacterium RIFCSPLOWO2_01_FULL_53_17]
MPDPRDIQKTALSITRVVGSPASIVIHTFAFAASFLAVTAHIIDFDRMLLILTTIVSLEAIYLAIFIQMTINYQAQSLAAVQEDVEEITEDVGEIQEDVEELQENVEDISEDVEEMSEEEETEEQAEERRKTEQKQTLDDIQSDLRRLIEDVERLKHNHASDNTKPFL